MIILRQKEFNDKPPRKKITDPIRDRWVEKLIKHQSGTEAGDILKPGTEGHESLRKLFKESKGKSNKGTGIKIGEKGVFAYYVPEEDTLHLNPRAKASTIAHELGHAQHWNGRSKNPITNLNARVDAVMRDSKLIKKSGGLGLVNGFASGFKEGKTGEKDKKGAIISYAIPTALNTPMLLEEADASRRGIKMLKASGMKGKSLKDAKKSLAYGFGTYAIRPAAQIAMTGVGRVSGKVVGRLSKKNNNENTKTGRKN